MKSIIQIVALAALLTGCSQQQLQRWSEIQRENRNREPQSDPYADYLKAKAAQPQQGNLKANCYHQPIRDGYGNVISVNTTCY